MLYSEKPLLGKRKKPDNRARITSLEQLYLYVFCPLAKWAFLREGESHHPSCQSNGFFRSSMWACEINVTPDHLFFTIVLALYSTARTSHISAFNRFIIAGSTYRMFCVCPRLCTTKCIPSSVHLHSLLNIRIPAIMTEFSTGSAGANKKALWTNIKAEKSKPWEISTVTDSSLCFSCHSHNTWYTYTCTKHG